MLADEIRDIFVRDINRTVYDLNSEDASETYKVKNFKDLNFDLKFIMK